MIGQSNEAVPAGLLTVASVSVQSVLVRVNVPPLAFKTRLPAKAGLEIISNSAKARVEMPFFNDPKLKDGNSNEKFHRLSQFSMAFLTELEIGLGVPQNETDSRTVRTANCEMFNWTRRRSKFWELVAPSNKTVKVPYLGFRPKRK